MRVFDGSVLRDFELQLFPAARFNQSENRNQQRAGPDQDELQHFVENRGAQPAERYIDRHGDRRNPDAEIDVPAQHHFHHQRHRVHVDAAHQHGHEREGNRGKRAAGFAEAQFQIARDRMRLGNVIKRHHHQAEKEHGRNGADPIPMRRQDSVLIGGGRPAHQFERAEIRGKEAEAGDPGRHFAAGEEEIFAGIGTALEVKADRQNEHKIKDDDNQVNEGKMYEPCSGECREESDHR